VIPHIPASINVVGAVNDQNSFLYAQGRRVGSYLRIAGGPTKDADSETLLCHSRGWRGREL
jgi:protein involved in polysaccharide export with SLBB domain